MCPYNSFVHGMIMLYKTDCSVQQYIRNSSMPYFKNLSKIMDMQNVKERQRHWFEYVASTASEEQLRNFDMSADMIDLIAKHFKDFETCMLE